MFNSTYLYQLVHAARDYFSNMYIVGKILIIVIFLDFHHDDFVAVKMCHSPNPTPLGFMHMQVYCFPV